MHVPERLKRNRTVVGAHPVTIAPRPPLALRRLLLLLPFRGFSRQLPQTFCTFAQIVRAQQLTRPPQQTCRRKIVLPAGVFRFRHALIPSHNMLRSNGLPRIGVVQSGSLHAAVELENRREQYPKELHDSDGHSERKRPAAADRAARDISRQFPGSLAPRDGHSVCIRNAATRS